jgi:hypothetical protein
VASGAKAATPDRHPQILNQAPWILLHNIIITTISLQHPFAHTKPSECPHFLILIHSRGRDLDRRVAAPVAHGAAAGRIHLEAAPEAATTTDEVTADLDLP